MSNPEIDNLGYCGLICTTCPIYLATRADDLQVQKKMRTEIARLCREEYGLNYDPKDISDCDGCRTRSDRLFAACKNCKIRICAREKGYESCALCADYPCNTLQEMYYKDPSAKTNLDRIRESKDLIFRNKI